MLELQLRHPVFVGSPQLRIVAVRSLAKRALCFGRSFRAQFDREDLRRDIGRTKLEAMMPNLPPVVPAPGAVEIHSEPLDRQRSSILARTIENYPWSLNSLSILDRDGRVVLRFNDRGTFALFLLPAPQLDDLLRSWALHGIPSDVVEWCPTVHADSLYP